MTTHRAALIVGLVLASTLAACSAGSVPSPSPVATTPPATSPPASAAPPTPVPDTGLVDPNPGGGGDGAREPGQPQFVVPKGGTFDPHPVAVETLEAQVTGRKVVIVATWWGGVEPCAVLDSVNVKRDGQAVSVSLTEGSAQRDAMCVAMAVQKATAIDLGALEPGTYTVAAQDSEVAPLSFTVN